MEEQPGGSNKTPFEQLLITNISRKHLKRFVLTIGVAAGCFFIH